MYNLPQAVTLALVLIAQPLNMNKHDLKTRNITLLTPSDAGFDDAVIRIAGNRGGITPTVKAASVVLQNTSGKQIVGYALTWHFLNADGTATDRKVTFFQPASLLDGNKK